MIRFAKLLDENTGYCDVVDKDLKDFLSWYEEVDEETEEMVDEEVEDTEYDPVEDIEKTVKRTIQTPVSKIVKKNILVDEKEETEAKGYSVLDVFKAIDGAWYLLKMEGDVMERLRSLERAKLYQEADREIAKHRDYVDTDNDATGEHLVMLRKWQNYKISIRDTQYTPLYPESVAYEAEPALSVALVHEHAARVAVAQRTDEKIEDKVIDNGTGRTV